MLTDKVDFTGFILTLICLLLTIVSKAIGFDWYFCGFCTICCILFDINSTISRVHKN